MQVRTGNLNRDSNEVNALFWTLTPHTHTHTHSRHNLEDRSSVGSSKYASTGAGRSNLLPSVFLSLSSTSLANKAWLTSGNPRHGLHFVLWDEAATLITMREAHSSSVRSSTCSAGLLPWKESRRRVQWVCVQIGGPKTKWCFRVGFLLNHRRKQTAKRILRLRLSSTAALIKGKTRGRPRARREKIWMHGFLFLRPPPWGWFERKPKGNQSFLAVP